MSKNTKNMESKVIYIAFPQGLEMVKSIKLHDGNIYINTLYSGGKETELMLIKKDGDIDARC